MKTIKLEIEFSNSDRRRKALVNAGVAPSTFGFRVASQAHRDRKAASRRGERKHKSPWA
jgi:hypothetical protein